MDPSLRPIEVVAVSKQRPFVSCNVLVSSNSHLQSVHHMQYNPGRRYPGDATYILQPELLSRRHSDKRLLLSPLHNLEDCWGVGCFPIGQSSFLRRDRRWGGVRLQQRETKVCVEYNSRSSSLILLIWCCLYTEYSSDNVYWTAFASKSVSNINVYDSRFTDFLCRRKHLDLNCRGLW